MADSIDILKKLALQVRNASTAGENTAERVGRTLVGIIDNLGQVDIEELAKIFLRKTKPDSTSYLLKLLAGAEFGQFATGTSGARIDPSGNAELLDLILRGVQTIGKYVSGVSGGRITASGWSELEALLLREGIRTVDFATGALGSGFCLKKDENGDTYLEVDRMLVRKTATFIQLTIQEVKHVGGQIVLTSASMKCTRVQEFTQYYRCYFEDTDGERTIENLFVAGDQARCQTFNIKPGVHENVSNQYYWRLVLAVGDDYIDLSKSDCDAGSTAPQEGDEIVQLGNRTDAARQCAIILSAFGEDAPYFKMYRGINSYQLSGKEFVNVSRTSVKIIADTLEFSTGETVKQYIDTQVGNSKTEIKEEVQEAVLGVVDDKIIGAVHTEVTTVVSEMEFGGRNYVLKSEGPQTAANKTYNLSIPLSEFAGESIALSFDYEYSNVSTGSEVRQFRFGLEVQVKDAGDTTNYITVSHDLPANSTGLSGKGRFSTVRTVPSSAQSGGSTVSAFIQVLSGTVEISHIKVEKGTVATDWTPAPEDLETIAEQAQLVAGQAVNAANDAAQAAADAAQEALDAQNRLDSWAADGVISPTEKQALKDEIARIDADKEEITDGYTRYGLGTPTAFNTAYNAYRSQLVTLTAATPEVIAIPSDFAEKQEAYYTARTAALEAIATAAKTYIDQKETSITQSVTDSIWQVLPEEIKGQVTTEVNTIIGGADIAYRNLVKEGDYGIEGSSNYFIKEVELYTELVEGEEYTMVLSGSLGSGKQFGIWDDVAIHNQGFLTNLAGRIYALTFTYERDTSSTRSDLLRLYNWPQSTTAPCDVDWVCLYKGEPVAIPEYFIPAWEDEDAKIIAVREWMSGQLSVTDQKIQATVEKITTVDNKLSGYVTTEAYTSDITQLSNRITATVNSISTVEDKLSGYVTTEQHQSDLDMTAESITSSVTSTFEEKLGDYVTLSQYSTKIEQLDNSISLKASQSSVDSLTGRISTAESEIKQTANAISLKVWEDDIDDAVTDLKETGFSLCPQSEKDWEYGAFLVYDTVGKTWDDMKNDTSNLYLRTIELVPIAGASRLSGEVFGTGFEFCVAQFDKDKLYLGGEYFLQWGTKQIAELNNSCRYIAICLRKSNGSAFSSTGISSVKLRIESVDVMNSALLATGIDITAKQITVTAPSFRVQDNSGTPIAVFKMVGNNPVLQAPYIDVDNLTVKHLEGAEGTFDEIYATANSVTYGNNCEMRLTARELNFELNNASGNIISELHLGGVTSQGANAVMDINVNNNNMSNNVISGIRLDVSGATVSDWTYNARVTGNHAMLIESGDICGFRLFARRLTRSFTVDKFTNCILCVNTTGITVTLPSTSEHGQILFIVRCNSGGVTVRGHMLTGWYGSSDYSESFSMGNTDLFMFIYDGIAKAWIRRQLA